VIDPIGRPNTSAMRLSLRSDLRYIIEKRPFSIKASIGGASFLFSAKMPF
jgi:hypothetical protein